MTALRTHQRPDLERDGLTGRTEAERHEIEARIARVSAAKARVEGRALTPFEIAMALGLGDESSPLRRCTACKGLLPATADHFHRTGGGRLHSRCKPCLSRYNAKYLRPRDEGVKAKRRERDRRYYWRCKDRLSRET